MLIADIPGANQRAVMRGLARMTPKYAVEITLYDYDGMYPIEVLWDPDLPSPAKQKALARKIDAALVPFYDKALELGRLPKGGAS